MSLVTTRDLKVIPRSVISPRVRSSLDSKLTSFSNSLDPSFHQCILLCQRMRPLQSPAIAKLSGNLFALLASSTPEGASLRTAFLPALTRSSTARFSQTLDDRLRSLLTVPPTVVVIQGTIQADAAEKLWEVEERGDDAKARSGMGSSIYLSFSLHTELLRAIEEREEVEEANLSSKYLCRLLYA